MSAYSLAEEWPDSPLTRHRGSSRHTWCSDLHDADTEVVGDEELLSVISAAYEMANSQAVALVLKAEPALMHTLCDAHGQIRSAFGTDSRLAIESVDDSDSRQTLLRVTVNTPKSAATAFKSMDRFYDVWWVKRSAKERSLIVWTARPGR